MPKVTSFALYDPEVSLYTCLNVTKDADQATIKKAYYKLALAHHPDKQSPTSTDSERDQATARFQRLGFAYAVLGNPQRRRVYDETGDVSEDGITGGFGAQGQAAGGWDAYFRELWSGIVNESTIKEFERTYRFSDEEKRDVIHAYVTYRGDMDGILSAVPVCTYADEERFRKMIQSAIDAKVARKYKAFGGPVVDAKAAARRKREAEAEAAEAEKLWKELGLERLKNQSKKRKKTDQEQGQREPTPESGSERELQLMMMQNGKNRQGAMDAILERYSQPTTTKKKKTSKKAAAAAASDEGSITATTAASSASSSSSSAIPQQQYHQQQQQQQQQRYLHSEISEDEFMATQARLLGRKATATAVAVGIHPSLTTTSPYLHQQSHTLSNYSSTNQSVHHGLSNVNAGAYRASQQQQHHHQQQQQQQHQQHQHQQQHMVGGSGRTGRGRM
ncbi:hypothetical protein BGX28_009407 [Mortierella sp. GBA30]|nr:hypothetical protein BGX28_009407 [Mortierella sp. GBA30]